MTCRHGLSAVAPLVAVALLLTGCDVKLTGYAALGGSDAGPPAIVIRLSHPLPAEDRLSAVVGQFARAVDQGSGERLKVFIYPNSQLVRLDEQIVEAVAAGRADVAIIPDRYVEKAIPAQAIESLPFLFSHPISFDVVSQNPDLRAALDEAYGQRNLVLVDWYVTGWSWFASKQLPIVRPSDLRGLRVAVSEREAIALVSLAGGIPVQVDDVAAAALRGDIDAAFVSTDNYAQGPLRRLFPFYPKADSIASFALLVANRTFWNSLPPDLQRVVGEGSRRSLSTPWTKSNTDLEADDWKALARAGVDTHALNDEDRASWREVSASIQADYVRRAGPLGQKLIDIIQKGATQPAGVRPSQ